MVAEVGEYESAGDNQRHGHYKFAHHAVSERSRHLAPSLPAVKLRPNCLTRAAPVLIDRVERGEVAVSSGTSGDYLPGNGSASFSQSITGCRRTKDMRQGPTGRGRGSASNPIAHNSGNNNGTPHLTISSRASFWAQYRSRPCIHFTGGGRATQHSPSIRTAWHKTWVRRVWMNPLIRRTWFPASPGKTHTTLSL